MTRLARTLALSLVLATGGAAATHHVAAACGGYTITEAQRAQWALAAFLGQLGERVNYGRAIIRDGRHARIVVELDTARGARRAKVQQTFLLEKRDGAWTVVDWTFPVAAPGGKVATR